MLGEHFLVYLTTTGICYALVYFGYPFGLLGLSWGIFGLVSVGHELYHLPKRTFFQTIVAWCCLDLWVTSKKIWIDKHNHKHHIDTWGENDHEHLIEGSLFKNLVHTFWTLTGLYQVFDLTWTNLILMTLRILIFYPLPWYSLIFVYGLVTFWVTILTFIAHVGPVLRQDYNRARKQLHRAVEIFPDSQLTTLIWGGFNLHASHHLNPTLTRDNLESTRKYYQRMYPDSYLIIDSWSELWKLYGQRGKTFASPEERRKAIKGNR